VLADTYRLPALFLSGGSWIIFHFFETGKNFLLGLA
jgi:hypothetical protein